MKVVILAGGYGTRISEESHLKPKPMIEIGDKPILWHIMKSYSHFGYNDFVICLGYKGYVIKEFFADYYLHTSDVTFDFLNQNMLTVHNNVTEPWRVTLVNTGLDTMTGGRIKRIRKYVGDERFMLTYGDGVADVDLNQLKQYHINSEAYITMTSIQPGGRFGVLAIDEATSRIDRFVEKSVEDGGWINGGFMIVEPKVFDYIEDDTTVFEADTLVKIAHEGKLNAYKHYGFWQCMDTQRDKGVLENLWRNNKAPWKLWE
ncbi:glucose-1-phosphate cytidylyltransferase [Paenibacillus sp. FSL R7-0273]|uniref:glucose-1-phosphate cytidylyltransferase n=1 Tax=Paenibacillus sp. FSL R7-0273 TaxID=1536772 RepID=UPI0004F61B5D|nr:glucose-1-phosphate cytidylyltransferase [Paenibacillus sp. FSL R7-0273]AIQ49701.1 glucose-1-phosphate cytidylyltransferase [Paenibacillus sp. FSL R7-0273]OMF90239.1 glucose-1-phosphate cytidylyltransferase [Paenibacillus sp. FSL R7-0273]